MAAAFVRNHPARHERKIFPPGHRRGCDGRSADGADQRNRVSCSDRQTQAWPGETVGRSSCGPGGALVGVAVELRYLSASGKLLVATNIVLVNPINSVSKGQ